MAKVFIGVIYALFNLLANTIFSPIFTLMDALILGLNLDPFVDVFTSVLQTYVTPYVGWFLVQIPPQTLSVIALGIGFTISFFAISFSVNIILKVLKLIKKLPMA